MPTTPSASRTTGRHALIEPPKPDPTMQTSTRWIIALTPYGRLPSLFLSSMAEIHCTI